MVQVLFVDEYRPVRCREPEPSLIGLGVWTVD
jgi:hypothetical protein